MKLLITRPQEDGNRLQKKLAARGIESVVAPVLHLTFEDLSDADLTSAQATLITSRNALKSLSLQNLIAPLTRKQVFTVAEQTAQFARSLGLQSVHAGPGTAKTLAEHIALQLKPERGPLHHIRGAHIAYDLTSDLVSRGFTVRETIAYRAQPLPDWPASVRNELSGNTVNGVILMSARSADAFSRLILHHDLTACLTRMHYFCLSDAVKDTLTSGFSNIRQDALSVPDRPNTEELLALISRFAAKYDKIQ